MRTSPKMWLAVFLVVLPSAAGRSVFAAPQAPSSPAVPVSNGKVGACSADFVVSDTTGKGLYDAKISIQVQYGFLGAHKLGLNVGTNYEGKARLDGLPEKIKGTAEFKVTHGDQSKSVPYDPLTNCHPRFEVTLGGAQTPQ